MNAAGLEALELINHNRDVCLIDLNKVRVVQEALHGEVSLLFSFLDAAEVLCEPDLVFVETALGLLGLALVQLLKDVVDLTGNTHASVLYREVFEVGLRVGWLARGHTLELSLFSLRFLLFKPHSFLEGFLLKEVLVTAAPLRVEVTIDLSLDFEVVAIFLPLQGLILSVKTLVQDALEFGLNLLELSQVVLGSPLALVRVETLVVFTGEHLQQKHGVHG